MPKTAFGIWMLHSVARVVAYFQLERGLGMGSEESKWQIPEYPVLDAQK
jgi:hypothetical protein